MADKQPTIAVLDERLGTAVKVAKWVGGVFGLVIFAIAGYFFSKISDHGEKLAAIQTHIESIEAEQKKTIPALIAEALKNPSPDNLKAVARVLESSRKLDKKSDPELLASDGQALYRLATSPTPPVNIWLASAQLVSYRSEQSQASLGTQAPDCFSQPPSTEVRLLPDHKTFQITGKKIYRSCVLHLDKADSRAYDNPDGSVFERCVVEYSGGPVKLYGPLEFKDCLFMLNASDEIPALGRRLVLALLKAPNLSSVDFALPFSEAL